MLRARDIVVTLPLTALACFCTAATARAQADQIGRLAQGPVVQPLPPNTDKAANDQAANDAAINDTMTLNAALARLGRNPRDLQGLIDAGEAALAIGDVDAAIGFYSRAEQVTPGIPRVKAGLARALVRSGNPFDALPLFDEAERAGPIDSAAALDRGLAHDLVADNAAAQRYYRQAMAGGQSDEATRRLAISLAIAGDKRGSGTALSPLLLRQDKAAWRARAFALAIMGQADEAIQVVNTTLPGPLAAGIAPYLRYMPRLTPAQQAAAANFGQFPRASEIGRDDPRVARYAPPTARRPSLAAADAALIPRGEPLGRNTRGRDTQSSNRPRNADAVARQRRSEAAVATAPVPPAPVPRTAPVPVPPPVPVPVRVAPAAPAAPPPGLPTLANPFPAAPAVTVARNVASQPGAVPAPSPAAIQPARPATVAPPTVAPPAAAPPAPPQLAVVTSPPRSAALPVRDRPHRRPWRLLHRLPLRRPWPPSRRLSRPRRRCRSSRPVPLRRCRPRRAGRAWPRHSAISPSPQPMSPRPRARSTFAASARRASRRAALP